MFAFKNEINHPQKWGEYFTVHSYEADFNGKARLVSIFQYLQEIAWHHAKVNKRGYYDLAKINKGWVLSRMAIHIDQYPLWGEPLQIITWPKGLDRLFALRDFQIYRGDELLGVATSCWLIIDLDSRRPQRPEPYFREFDFSGLEDAWDYKMKNLPNLQKPSNAYKVQVGYNDLDVNQHVTSYKYIEWACNAFPLEQYKNQYISHFEIHFMNEIRSDDQVTVTREKLEEQPSSFMVAGISDKEEREAFKAKIIWS